MKSKLMYLNDSFISFYKFTLILAFPSIFLSLVYPVFIRSLNLDFLLFIKIAGLTILIIFIEVMSLWKKYQFSFENSKENKTKHCKKLEF